MHLTGNKEEAQDLCFDAKVEAGIEPKEEA